MRALQLPFPPSGPVGHQQLSGARPAFRRKRFSHLSIPSTPRYHVEHMAAAVESWRMALRTASSSTGSEGGDLDRAAAAAVAG